MEATAHPPAAVVLPSLGLLCRLRWAVMRNRVRQLVNESPMKLLLVILFICLIWAALYKLFDGAFIIMRRFDQEATIATPYVFHIFFAAMTVLLAFSTAVLTYGATFSGREPSFLLPTPCLPRHIVMVMYLEALFFASWSLVLLGIPLMIAFGQAQGLSWQSYVVFFLAFLGFLPIPGSLGLFAALIVALWLPRQARKILLYSALAAVIAAVIWWGRLWTVSSNTASEWLDGVLGELQYLKGALLPSTWVTEAIRNSVAGRADVAFFYVAVTVSTGLFFSWVAVTLTGAAFLRAFSRAQQVGSRRRRASGSVSRWLVRLVFLPVPGKMRLLVLKDLRTFLRDPVQWSQLLILLGLLGLYLTYLPRARPEGFDLPWQALICFLNYGAVTLILSTFTSRFVFPLMSLEGRQMWLVGLWPLSCERVIWSKWLYAVTVTGAAALVVTCLSIRALDLPVALATIQVCATLSTCAGLCGLAVGLGARMPNYRERNASRIASGLGGTINLIASVGLVTVSVFLFGVICYGMAGAGSLGYVGWRELLCFVLVLLIGAGATWLSMVLGLRRFRRQES